MGAKKLNKLQLHFIQFFLDRDIDDDEGHHLRKLIAEYYFDKAQSELGMANK
jgi:hypothetical protein